jgi:hypothetical protein
VHASVGDHEHARRRQRPQLFGQGRFPALDDHVLQRCGGRRGGAARALAGRSTAIRRTDC